jgi:hypothetical protein
VKDQILKTRVFSNLGVSLCANAIDIAGMKLVPDESKAYAEFTISHAWPVVTAYGTALHPGTVANSWRSLVHQVFNEGHKMRAYDQSRERDQIGRDFILGTVVAVEYPGTPLGGWRLAPERGSAPGIRAAAVIHKHAEHVPKILGEHLGGRHKWTVSMEVNYSILSSGFVVLQRERASKLAAELLDAFTPDEFTHQGLGYVAMEQAPEELLGTYDFDQKRMRPNASWQGLPVVLLKGGVSGQVHYQGVGLVRYGAEREAQVQQILATDPDAFEGLTDENFGLLVEYFRGLENNFKKLLTSQGKAASRV